MRSRIAQPRRIARTVQRLGAANHQHGARFILLVAQFHPAIADALARGATQALRRNGIAASAIQLLRVPGAFELPLVAAHVASRRPAPAAIIALGALIHGETPQYAVIADAVAGGLSHVAVTTKVPVTFGVIVAETLAQAKARAGGVFGNRGKEAALAALSMVRLVEKIT